MGDKARAAESASPQGYCGAGLAQSPTGSAHSTWAWPIQGPGFFSVLLGRCYLKHSSFPGNCRECLLCFSDLLPVAES